MTALQTLADLLSHRTKSTVTVTLTQNRRRLVSVNRRDGTLRIRLHQQLMDAPEAITEALCRFVADGCNASRRLIRDHLGTVCPPTAHRPLPQRPMGRFVDLAPALTHAAELLPVKRLPAITWGPRRRPGARRVRLGSYDPQHCIIRINPVLDHPGVPQAMVRFVVYHELLHHHMAEQGHDLKGSPHGKRFRELEQQSPDKPLADHWQRTRLNAHLNAARVLGARP